MANISDKVQQIRQAVYGKDVRESIASGIEAINTEVESTTARQDSLETTFDQLIINAGNSNAEVVDARVKADNTVYPTLRDRLNDVDSQLAEKATIEPLHFHVGKNQKYKTISDAVWAWINVYSKQSAIVHISAGEYNEVIKIDGGRNISFIGEDKSKVIWRTKTGYYKDTPLSAQGGNLFIKGITFIADRTDNPDFIEQPLTAGNPATDNIGCAYALHVDYAGAGRTEIVDCDLISYQNAALGCGTRQDQEILVRNTRMYSYTPSSFSTLSNGALLYHTFNGTATNQKFRMHNCYLFSENGRAFEHQNISTGLTGSETELIGNNFSSNTVVGEDLVRLLNGANLSNNSFGNNVNKCNKISASGVQIAKLTQDNGNCLLVTDFNNATCGTFMGNGANGCLNTPKARWFIGFAIKYDNDFIVQYAWDITSKYEMYKRYKRSGAWSPWRFCVEDKMPEGTTAQRPTLDGINDRGYVYFDTTLTKVIWWNGATWISFSGNMVGA